MMLYADGIIRLHQQQKNISPRETFFLTTKGEQWHTNK